MDGLGAFGRPQRSSAEDVGLTFELLQDVQVEFLPPLPHYSVPTRSDAGFSLDFTQILM